MNFSEFEKNFSFKNIKAFYLIYSEDPYLSNWVISRLEKLLKEKYTRFEKIRWDGTEQNFRNLFLEVEALPFFFDHRLIVATSFEKSKDFNVENLIQHSSSLLTSTLVLITEKKESFKKNSKFIHDSDSLIECLKPSLREVPSWLVSFAKEENKILKLSDAKIMIELLGGDLFSLYHQTKLLALYVGERKEITSEDLNQLFSEISEKNVFQLTQKIAQKNLKETFILLQKLFTQGEVPLKLFGLLARHYRILLKVKLALRKRMTSREIASFLKLPFFVVEESIALAEKISWKELIKIYHQLEESDLALKSSAVSSSLILEKMLWANVK